MAKNLRKGSLGTSKTLSAATAAAANHALHERLHRQNVKEQVLPHLAVVDAPKRTREDALQMGRDILAQRRADKAAAGEKLAYLKQFTTAEVQAKTVIRADLHDKLCISKASRRKAREAFARRIVKTTVKYGLNGLKGKLWAERAYYYSKLFAACDHPDLQLASRMLWGYGDNALRSESLTVRTIFRKRYGEWVPAKQVLVPENWYGNLVSGKLAKVTLDERILSELRGLL